MNLTSDTVASFFKAIVDALAAGLGSFFGSLGPLTKDSPDGGLGVAVSGLAGVAAALAVAVVLTVYFRSRYRSTRDILRHGLTAIAVLGLLAFVVYDMRNAALAYFGINPSKPEVELQIRPAKAAAIALADGFAIRDRGL